MSVPFHSCFLNMLRIIQKFIIIFYKITIKAAKSESTQGCLELIFFMLNYFHIKLQGLTPRKYEY